MMPMRLASDVKGKSWRMVYETGTPVGVRSCSVVRSRCTRARPTLFFSLRKAKTRNHDLFTLYHSLFFWMRSNLG